MQSKKCILLGTIVAAVLVILNMSLNANVPTEPCVTKVNVVYDCDEQGKNCKRLK